jgi:RNA polymerase-binding transcription factor DksA
LAGIELDRVETLLRERSAEMTRTRGTANLHPSLDSTGLDAVAEREEAPVVEVTHEGACTDCGDRISSARLKALPDAVRCVTCQRQRESQTG